MCKKIIFHCQFWKQLPNIFVETVILFLSFDEKKVQKNSIYLKYKYFVTL